jgi:photosystem II stability/assembly factor-like uncharacterized protein
MLRLCFVISVALLSAQSPARESAADRLGGGPAGSTPWSIIILPGSPVAILMSDSAGGVFRSVDGGASWTFADEGLPDQTVELSLDPRHPGLVLAYEINEKRFFESIDQGGHWTEIDSSARPDHPIAVDPANPAVQYHVTWNRNGILKTTDGGRTWQTMSRGLPADPNIAGLAIDPRTPDILLAGTGFPVAMYKTTNGGAIWNRTDEPDSAFNRIIAFAPSNPQIVYTQGRGSLLKSLDAGEHWSELDLDATVNGFAVDPVSADTVYAATWRGALKTTDGGRHWTVLRAGLGRSSVTVACWRRNRRRSWRRPRRSTPVSIAGTHGPTAAPCPFPSQTSLRRRSIARIFRASCSRVSNGGMRPRSTPAAGTAAC